MMSIEGQVMFGYLDYFRGNNCSIFFRCKSNWAALGNIYRVVL